MVPSESTSRLDPTREDLLERIRSLEAQIGRLEQQQRCSDERFRLAFDEAADGIFWVDIEKQTIARCNQRAPQILGLAIEDIVGSPHMSLYPADKVEQYTWLLEEHGPTVSHDVQCVDASGDLKTYHVTASQAVVASTAILQKVFREISSRALTERVLQDYADELEYMNKDLREFAYVVSHDLRAPMINLKGFSAELRISLESLWGLLQRHFAESETSASEEMSLILKEELPESLDFIDSSVSRMDHLITCLLKLSRFGRREMALEPLNMNDLTEHVLRALAHQTEEKGIEITVAELPSVVADRTSLEQVLSNLISNAIQYVDPERPCKIVISGETGAAESILCVRDNGRGIAEEDYHRIFSPFRRAGTQNTKGEGMGLAYCQALLRRHGGRVWCESELGMGTVFSFSIPNGQPQGDSDAKR